MQTFRMRLALRNVFMTHDDFESIPQAKLIDLAINPVVIAATDDAQAISIRVDRRQRLSRTLDQLWRLGVVMKTPECIRPFPLVARQAERFVSLIPVRRVVRLVNLFREFAIQFREDFVVSIQSQLSGIDNRSIPVKKNG